MHPSIQGLLRWFDSTHMQDGPAKDASKWIETTAYKYAQQIQSSAELTAGLRKLLEAKDCIVRAVILQEENRESSNAGEEDGS